MFKRIKNLIELSKSSQNVIENAVKAMNENAELQGDGKSCFFDEGTTEEYEELQREDKFGIKKLFGIK